MTPIAEQTFELKGSDEIVVARIFAPVCDPDDSWFARIELTGAIEVSLRIGGATSLQALVLAIKVVSIHLYGSDLWKAGELGIYGEFGGDLGIPAPTSYQDFAPYPF
jgi:hypothetical protein